MRSGAKVLLACAAAVSLLVVGQWQEESATTPPADAPLLPKPPGDADAPSRPSARVAGPPPRDEPPSVRPPDTAPPAAGPKAARRASPGLRRATSRLRSGRPTRRRRRPAGPRIHRKPRPREAGSSMS